MNKIPFSVYDFFGYLAAGTLVLATLDFSSGSGWLLKDSISVVFGVFWTMTAYITGHIVAHISSVLLEKKFLRGTLGSPEEIFFKEKKTGGWARLFPGHYASFPKKTQDRILRKAKEKAGIESPGRALFYHCHPIVLRQQVAQERLNTFLNLYGFCRNVSMASLLAILILLSGFLFIDGPHAPDCSLVLWSVIGAFVTAVGMFYRYLKFFRHYTEEVFRTYAETNG